MTTTLQRKAGHRIDGQRFVLSRVGWDGYQALLKLVGDRPIRITYDRGDVELMTPLSIHERYKRLIGRMIDVLTDEFDIDVMAAGSTTFNREDVDRGLEPDECYYFANAGRVRDWRRIDLDVDPPPDLAIEIDITGSSLDRLNISAALRIPEVWRFDGETLIALLLQDDGTYMRAEKSLVLPFVPLGEIARFLREYESSIDTHWARTFRAWVRDVLAPRVRGEGRDRD